MEQIISHFDKVISLGSTCYMKKLIDTVTKQETHFFDWIGSSVWSINLLIENDFKNIFEQNDFHNMHVMTAGNFQNCYTNKKYYLRFAHDFDQADVARFFRQKQKKPLWQSKEIINKFDNDFIEFKNKYERRAERIQNILNTKQRILFLRFEEPSQHRVYHNIYLQQLKISESTHLINFSEIVKRKYPDADCMVIYFSKNCNSNYDKTNGIITIKDTLNIDNWDDCIEKLNKLIDNNIDLIMNSIVI